MRKQALCILIGIAIGALAMIAQQKAKAGAALTALDYAEIGQLAERYGLYIDTCSNNGYDYADLYTPDGIFIDNFTDEPPPADLLASKRGVKRASKVSE